MQNDKPEPFNQGGHDEAPISSEELDRTDAIIDAVAALVDSDAFATLRVTLYAAQSAHERVTTGAPICSVLIEPNAVDSAFALAPAQTNQLLVALATGGNLAVRVERGAV